MKMVERGADFTSDLRLDAGAIVVGLGAGGAMALRSLARAGIPCVGLEEGGDPAPAEMSQREDDMLAELYQERGGRMTDDLAIHVLQGRGVGGSTIHNTNLCKRIPPEILELWERKHGVDGCSERDMLGAFEEVERDLHVQQVAPDQINANNAVLRRGLAELGWRGGPLSHNRAGCQQSGFCEVGCAYDAKQNARKILVPDAMTHGARVFADVRATRILHEQGEVRGVSGESSGGRKVVVRAPIVVLGASAIGSAMLGLQSGLPDPHQQLGHALRLHPGAAVAGVFDDPVRGWQGIPQSYECTEWLDFAEASDRRVWITTAFAHPIGTAALLPGFGATHMRRMRDYDRFAVLTAMVHDETRGRVHATSGTRPGIHYPISTADRGQLALGLRSAARILLAAGAREVLVPSIPPRVVRTLRDVERIDVAMVRPHGLPMTSVHPMGTMRMGRDPRVSVVAGTGEHHQVRGLFVADGSLFPTSIGGPPQIPHFRARFATCPGTMYRLRAASNALSQLGPSGPETREFLSSRPRRIRAVGDQRRHEKLLAASRRAEVGKQHRTPFRMS